MIKLSIIVPVFNGECYIVEALSSYFLQADSSIQIIVVDDGSTDNTYFLIKSKFQEFIEAGTLILAKQKNSGVSSARNRALDYATGDYLTFLDSDDILLDGYVSNILGAINSYEPDVIEFGFKTFDRQEELTSQEDSFVYQKFGLIDFSDVKEIVYEKSIWYPCIRAFRRSLFEKRRFPEGVRFCEDMMILTEIYQDVRTVFHIQKSLYGYRMNSGGATFNIKPDYVANLLKFYESLPKTNIPHLDYLKINLAYLMYRCNDGKSLPIRVKLEFLKLFLRYLLDRKVSFRKKLILGFPDTYRLIKGQLRQ